MSRKTLLTILAVLGAVLGVFGTTFGLTLNATALVAGLGAVLVYLFFEAKADIARVGPQVARFKDPKFWLTVVSAALGALESSGIVLPIPTETIIAVLTAIVTVLFKAQAQATA